MRTPPRRAPRRLDIHRSQTRLEDYLCLTPLQLGQTVTVLFEFPRRDGVTRLPLTALMQQQGRTAVWLLDRQTMTVQVQPVEVAGAEGNAVVVASGLNPGQTVVTAGVHTLTPGQKVKLYEAPAVAPPASAGER